MPTRVAFLWHMHQPMYVDPRSGEAILPWVRLHATHAYYDMARMLERHARIRATVNFVPSLVEQLEDAVAGARRERYLEATRRRPEEMSPEERVFVGRQFFMADRARCVEAMPRYAELLAKRGDDPTRVTPSLFTDGELRDVQVLFNLAWMGFSARAEEPAVRALLDKGGAFTEGDKAALLDAQARILGKVLPLWKSLAASGRVELSSTPYFHPILPLLCDSDAARRAMPDVALPPRFCHPEDARRQVAMAIEKHTAVFGRPPRGMWPAEGSVSPEALEVFAEAGLGWLATDEAILFRSEPPPAARGQLYQAWRCATDGRTITLLFRDHQLSDRIGFDYARMNAPDAVRDFLGQLRQAAARAKEDGVAAPVIPVILDGENAWEHYEGKGEPFLDSLYGALEAAEELETVTVSEATAEPAGTLTRIHSGSWIDGNYRIWIGHPEDNLAWTLLGEVRGLLAAHESKGDVPGDRIERARRLLLSAEGSDWFWWYGDDFDTENAAEFDALFRDRLLRAAELLGEPPPARVKAPIGARARRQTERRVQLQLPTALIHPAIDGQASSYLRWIGAGSFQGGGAQGAMYRSSSVIASVRFGFDPTTLYLRIDPAGASRDGKLVVSVSKDALPPREILVSLRPGALAVPLEGAQGISGEVVELALPLAALGLAAGDRAQLQLRLVRDGLEIERLPPQAPLALDVPGPDFEERMWWV